MFDLTGKVALVTGASGAIGGAIALALAGQGADVALHCHSHAHAAEETARQVEKLGHRQVVLTADLRHTNECEQLWKDAEAALGPPDILVNNAGFLKRAYLGLLSETTWDETQDINLKSAYLLSKKAARSMTKRRQGRIINISSQAAQSGEVMAAHYSAAKAGLLGLTRAAARELAGSGITCNAIAPGFVESDMTSSTSEEQKARQLALIPLGRFGQAQEIAALAVYLASGEAAYVTGQVFAIDGGLRI